MTPPATSGDAFGIHTVYRHRPTGLTGNSLHDFTPAAPDLESVVEYLAFGEIWRVERTFLLDVARVPPPAPALDRQVVLSSAPAYELVEGFWETFRNAVWRAIGGASDVVVSLSGGLDSAAMAAAAVELVGTSKVRAVTMGFERDFDDPEPRFARKTAEFLGIEWAFVPADSAELMIDWIHTDIWPTEPTMGSRAAWDRLMPDEHGVILWGLGGDSLLRGDREHYQGRARRGEWREAFHDVWQAVVLRGLRPGFGLQARLRPRFSRPEPPVWLRPNATGFDTAACLRRDLPPTWRRGVDEMHAPGWSYYFETEAPENTLLPHRYVYPFFDQPLVDFVTALPTAPWCIDKEILRAALVGRIPDSVRTREKTPTVGEPLVTLSTDGAVECRDAIARGAADHLFDPRLVLDGLVPGVHRWSEIEEAMRCCAAARWLDRLTPPRQSTTNTLGGA